MNMKLVLRYGIVGLLPLFAQAAPARHMPRWHGPIEDRVEHDDGTSESHNWAGYAVTGTDFTSATASWVVPEVTCEKGDEYSSFWVGLDGYASDTVEQTGTSQDCEGKSAQYFAWYEFYPAAPVTVSLTITPGDVMSASVTYSGSDFTTTITDETTGKSATKTGTVSGAARSSAEWIAEAPASINILPLANFGTGYFGLDKTGVSATNEATNSSGSGTIGSFASADVEQITMATKKLSKATPSALSTDGTSFSVTWDHR